MKTLVTGATGFLGAAVTRKLVARGDLVKVLVRPGADRRALNGLHVEYAEGDVTDDQAVHLALRHCSKVFHLAGHNQLQGPPALHDKLNVEGTETLLGQALEHGVKRVVFTSCATTIGAAPPNGLANERTPWNLGEVGLPFLASKRRAEERALEISSLGLDVVVLNPAIVYGAGDARPSPAGQLILDFLNGRTAASPNAARSFIDVDDCAAAHLTAMERGRSGERYVLASHNITTGELYAQLARLTGLQAPTALPYPLFWVASFLGTLGGEWIMRRPVINNLAAAGYARKRLWFDTRKAKEELGLQDTPLAVSLHRTVAWYCASQGYLSDARRDSILARLDPAA